LAFELLYEREKNFQSFLENERRNKMDSSAVAISQKKMSLWTLAFFLGLLCVISKSAGVLFAEEEGTKVPVQTGSSQVSSTASITSNSSYDSKDPLEEMEVMLQKMNRLLQSHIPRQIMESWNKTGMLGQDVIFDPDLDLSETATHYVVKADLPGMAKNEIHIEATERQLTLSGERKVEKEERKDGGLYRKERSFGSFRRTLSLPEAVKVEGITADYNQGVLTVKLPKLVPDDQTRKVTVPIQ
jgi:HSP20 family protein